LQSDELLALADTIKMLIDNDALELFKSASAMKCVKSGRKGDRERLDVIMLAICGEKVNLDEVIKMIG